jgi:Flp pilus assembly protein TadG
MRARGIRSKLARFRAEDRGAAAVEFALILPFLLLLFMGSIEASSLITVDRRVNVISGTVGDLVARTEDALSSGTLNDYFMASQNIMYPYSTTVLKQVVTFVAVDDDGDTSVVWSCGYNGGTTRAAASTYALPERMNELARDSWVVASETWYSYRPVLGLVFTTAITLHRESFYLPRYQKAIASPCA